MNKLAAIILCFLLIWAVGCHKTQSEPPLWNVQKIWPRGSNPVPSPTGDGILFMQEDPPAGLYLLRNGAASILNPTGPDARADYAWSSDGTRFCFSAPGAPGSDNAGIYVAFLNAPTEFQKFWDRGSHPRFLPGTEGIICAGTEDTINGGIYQIALTNPAPQQVVPQGTSPEISPDGSHIAYLVVGDIQGWTLVTINRETGRRDTLTNRVMRYNWLANSQYLVIETNVNNNSQQIATVSVPRSGSPNTVASGTDPAPFPQGTGFVYTALAGDRLDGLFTASVGQVPVRITHEGTFAVPASGNRILAQDSSGILEITH